MIQNSDAKWTNRTLLLKIVEWASELRPLKGYLLISTPSGLMHAVDMMWFGCKIVPNTLKNPWKVVKGL
jgi:hypothetical protein